MTACALGPGLHLGYLRRGWRNRTPACRPSGIAERCLNWHPILTEVGNGLGQRLPHSAIESPDGEVQCRPSAAIVAQRCRLILVGAEHGDECFLRDVDAAELLHLRLPLLLLLQQLVFARHVAAIQLGGHILTVRLDRRPGDDGAADGALNRDLELVPRNRFGKLLTIVQRPRRALSRCTR